jgi:hypothetical protein
MTVLRPQALHQLRDACMYHVSYDLCYMIIDLDTAYTVCCWESLALLCTVADRVLSSRAACTRVSPRPVAVPATVRSTGRICGAPTARVINQVSLNSKFVYITSRL